MSFFSKEKVVLSSPLEGVITFNGSPAAGAKLERTLEFQDEKLTDTFIAEKDGSFSLPLVELKWGPLLPVQFVVHQRIEILYQGQEYVVWAMGKVSEELYGELGGVPKNLQCELTDELRRVEVEYGLLGTVCNWDSIE